MSEKTLVKISARLDKVSPLDIQNNQNKLLWTHKKIMGLSLKRREPTQQIISPSSESALERKHF